MSLRHGDLKKTISDLISVDEYLPKAGNENDVIVVAFHFTDKEPAYDLNTFIQRGIIDVIDVDVSPDTDLDGNFLVFVEMSRNPGFCEKFIALVKDIDNLSGDIDWKVKPYLADRTFDITDSRLFDYIVVDSKMYVKKGEFTLPDNNETIAEFFKLTNIGELTINENVVTLVKNSNKIIAEVVDVGDYNSVIERNELANSGFKLTEIPYEAKMLKSMLECDVFPIDGYLLISHNDDVMLLKGTYISYSR